MRIIHFNLLSTAKLYNNIRKKASKKSQEKWLIF